MLKTKVITLLEKYSITLKMILVLILILFLSSCGNEEYIPQYQEAIFIMNADGSNKQKVIDVDDCDNVQFIPNSNKLLYLAGNSLYTVNIDGTENGKISGSLNLYYARPVLSKDGKYCFFEAYENRMSNADIYEINLTDHLLTNLTNSPEYHEEFINIKDMNITFTSISENSIYSIIKYDIQQQIMETVLSGGQNILLKFPVFMNNEYEYLFFKIGEIGDSGLFFYNYANDYQQKIASGIESGIIYFISDNQRLFIDSSGIVEINVTTGNSNFLTEGDNPDFFSSKMIYSTDWGNYNSSIYLIGLMNNDKNKLTSNGYKPKFSLNGLKIVFVGQYITNPKRNIITN